MFAGSGQHFGLPCDLPECLLLSQLGDQKLQQQSPLLFPESPQQGRKAHRDAYPHTASL